MDYIDEAYELFDKLKEKYTIADLILISQRLLCMALAIFFYENKFDSSEKNAIFKRLEQTLPHGVEGFLKILDEMK
jgi:hypothetical protein